jgi:hypothetical protein
MPWDCFETDASGSHDLRLCDGHVEKPQCLRKFGGILYTVVGQKLTEGKEERNFIDATRIASILRRSLVQEPFQVPERPFRIGRDGSGFRIMSISFIEVIL